MKVLRLDDKAALVSLRGVIFVFLGFYTLYGPAVQADASWSAFAAAGLQLLSILALLPLPRDLLRDGRVQGAVFLADVAFISWAIHLSGASGGDLYLLYFIVILLSVMQKEAGASFGVGAVAAAAYAFLWRANHPGEAWLDVSVALRFPFFFIVAFFSAFFAGQHRDREARLRKTEQGLAEAQRLSVVGRLAGGLAHEFNSLLTVVLGHCEFLLQSMDRGDRRREEVESILAAANRMAAITRQFLAFSQRHLSRPEPMDLNGFLTDRRKPIEDLLGSTIRVEWALSPRLDRVMFDPEFMQQIIHSLAANARDAMPGGGALRLTTSQVSSHEDLSDLAPRREGFVRLCVEDTGCGMDPEVLPHVFEPFFTTKGPAKASGLGLSSVYGMVKKAGGAIAVESQPGLGTIIRLYFPAVRAPA
ncbi:MAG: hypothetical protein HY924_08565 [Elusimicrobia bacterium]|nr:hypothetical protein [Elusimicrobiota bacterium]